MADINKKNTIKTIIIHTLYTILVISVISVVVINIQNNNKEVKYLNDIIESDNNKIGKNTYLTIKSISPKFAIDNKNGYYFASDGEYNYVVYLNDDKAKELYNSDLEENPVKLYGVTKSTSNKVKEIAIETYNSGYDDEEKISLKDYYSYFGDVYLDYVNVK